ncbi:unnamed protein product [Gongylonema pulchrum]|uniref:Partner of xrn-2 protein 1-like C-terminal domain-containing protein n=1 Tax=Gongylonema pulchrum TaxID=637853 RepID=A0A3P7M451_9BILA|nr:unnamed protein product [Gongylonema pulchrum]
MQDRKRPFDHEPSTSKKPKLEKNSFDDIAENSPCAAKRKGVSMLKAQLSILEKGADPLKQLNQLTSRLKYKWEVKSAEDGKSALLVNDVIVLEGIFPSWDDAEAKNFVAAATLAAFSKENVEVRAKNGKFEMWQGTDSPGECYLSYFINCLKTAVKAMPSSGTSFSKLEGALASVRIPLRYVAEHGTGWEQRISISALNVELGSAVLRKGECTKSREKERKEELADAVIQDINNANIQLQETSGGYILKH